MSINELKIKVFIKTPPKTLKDYEARLEDNSVEKTTWYLAKKQF